MLCKTALIGSVLTGTIAALAATTSPTVLDRADVDADTFGDACRTIAGKKWVAPKDVRACFTSISVSPKAKDNIIEVVDKTLAAFHTSRYYQKRAPQPFAAEVGVDLDSEFARMRRTRYSSEYEFHLDFSRTIKRLNDGHAGYINACYDSVYLTLVPTPLVLLTDKRGDQYVHIAPEAWDLVSSSFSDQIDVWQNALPGNLRGKLKSLSGAKVLKINGQDPFKVVNAHAQVAGAFQGVGARQNGFFASYRAANGGGFNYVPGEFAQKSLPLEDSVTLTIQRIDSSKTDTVTLPYRSLLATGQTWTDKASFRQNLCVAQPDTNGEDWYSRGFATESDPPESPLFKFQQQDKMKPEDRKKWAVNVAVDSTPLSTLKLPRGPVEPTPLLSYSIVQTFLLPDKKTGVLTLGSFTAGDVYGVMMAMLDGLTELRSLGATQLIVDVTNNGGGIICLGHWLHRILAGAKSTTEPQAGLDTILRAGPLVQRLVKAVNEGKDDSWMTAYHTSWYRFPNNTDVPENYNYLLPIDNRRINDERVEFSPRLIDRCQPFWVDMPTKPIFPTNKVAIVSNGRCASTCAMLSIAMSKQEGSKTVVVGGVDNVKQQYCGIVGGESTDFVAMDFSVKSLKMKNHPLAPPDFITNSMQGITFRLGLGIWNRHEPEEWQDHPADYQIPLTAETVNKPYAVWSEVAKTVFKR
ncbi:hypothetical protein BXZ70DRAFT_1009250 [Cristinia sonorae]|uniref:Tail specific protease domain-containing protein n=1 Tax=Cristinia sonorae TaxID=1940300 RepID=A0A8K0ULA7_9AGAR|nr:hypothetical protein BXZ70DRAFT_1009250 [Cristinia sonorae]